MLIILVCIKTTIILEVNVYVMNNLEYELKCYYCIIKYNTGTPQNHPVGCSHVVRALDSQSSSHKFKFCCRKKTQIKLKGSGDGPLRVLLNSLGDGASCNSKLMRKRME